jgi:hypothetical protein
MKKQLLHETHNLQDKAKKPDYQDRFQDEGGNFDRGGVSKKRIVSFRGSSIYIDLRPLLSDDKQSLLQTLEFHWKFLVGGEVGTIPQLMRNPRLFEQIKKCREMTRLSVLRAQNIIDVAKHPNKNAQFDVLEFNCFLQPLEPFPNPIFKKRFAFLMRIAQQRG